MVTGTVLPFSTSGGTSSFTLPAWMTAPPVTSRMAAAIISGVACAGSAVRIGTTVAIAMPAVPARNWRRIASVSLIIFMWGSFAQSHQISHDILDLFGGQDGFAAPRDANALQSIGAIIG